VKAPPGFRGTFRTDDLSRALYAEGAGIARAIPVAVAVPENADAVQALVRWARDGSIALVPRGSGSGMAGGAVGSGVIVDLSRLRERGRVDVSRGTIRVGAGVLRGEVEEVARAGQLRFPVDPSSGRFATIGGMAATNAAGAHSLQCGSTRAWVESMDCVFADGSRAELRRGTTAPPGVAALQRFEIDCAARAREVGARLLQRPALRKNSSGYALSEYATSGELVDLLVGSEGSLALFVALELRLAPLPRSTASLLALFDSLEGAVDAASACRDLGASACELLDRTFLEVAHSGDPSAPVAEAALLIEMEGDTDADAEAGAERLRRACDRRGAREIRLALDPGAAEVLWSLRHAASPILAKLDPALRSMQFIEDGALPPHRLPEYVRGVRAALERRGIRGVIFGHAGDAHVHVNPLIDVRRSEWRRDVEELLAEVCELTARLGGTLAGEHGDGRLRTPLLASIWPPEAIAVFAGIKKAFDPAGILNPGVKVPLPGQQPIEAVKYDPEAPPLPAAAREALDAVERDRAWDRYRLSIAHGED
jgi:FAD/FMN-containing dehydrogenase